MLLAKPNHAAAEEPRCATKETEMPADPEAALALIQQRLSDILREDLQLGRKHNPAICAHLYNQRRRISQQLPNFWLTSLLSHPAMSLIITSNDALLLRQLTDIDVRVLNQRGIGDFEIVFSFSPNQYFSNSTVSKRYTFTDDNGRVIANTPMQWNKENKAPKAGFFTWLCSDTRDSSHLGELIRQQIFVYTIELYFGTYKIDTDEGEELNSINHLN